MQLAVSGEYVMVWSGSGRFCNITHYQVAERNYSNCSLNSSRPSIIVFFDLAFE